MCTNHQIENLEHQTKSITNDGSFFTDIKVQIHIEYKVENLFCIWFNTVDLNHTWWLLLGQFRHKFSLKLVYKNLGIIQIKQF